MTRNYLISTNLQDVHLPVAVQELPGSITTPAITATGTRGAALWSGHGKTRTDDRDAHPLLTD